MPSNSFSGFANTSISKLHDYQSKKLRSLAPDATVPKLTSMMNTYKIRTMPILEKGRFVGTVTQADVARHLPPNIKILPFSVLKDKDFNFDELIEGSQNFKAKRIKDVFEDILDIKEDEEIAVISSTTSLLNSIKCFVKQGANNRRYRTLMIREGNRYDGVLSYLDVFKIILTTDVLGGLLSQKIGERLSKKEIFISAKTDCLADAIFTLDHNLFTHLPIAADTNSKEVIGFINESMIRSLQYEVIYEHLEDMELSKILEIQRLSFEDMTVKSTDTIKVALEKFTQSRTRPQTLLVGEINEGSVSVLIENTLSYVDMMRIIINFMDGQLENNLQVI